MKKKFISAMAISLCLCMGAMVGCGDNKNNSSSSSSPKEPLTKDEILAEIGDAYAATKAYKGGYTVTGTSKDEYKDFEDEEAEVYNGTMELTADPSQKIMYYKIAEEDGYSVDKLLKNGTDYIRYGESKSGENEANKNYAKWTEAYVAYYIDAYYSYENIIDNYVEAEVFDLESIDAYNTAYATVIANSVAEIEVGKENEESMFYGMSNASGSATISAVETEDGAYVYTSKMNLQISAPDYEDGKTVTTNTLSETVITAKDGKLVGMKEVSETTRTKQVSDIETQTYVSKREQNYTVSYTFDQAKYDGVSVTVPETVEPLNSYGKDFTLVVNGIERDELYVSGSSIAVAVDNLGSRLKSDLGVTEENATVSLYKDAAYTQALDGANMTEADFYALEKVYAKVELKEGYALVNNLMGYAFASDVTAEQKIAFGAMLGYTDQMGVQIVSVAQPVNLGTAQMQEEIPFGTVKAYVNDTACTEATFTAESEENYEVKYVLEMAKADLNIFVLYMD